MCDLVTFAIPGGSSIDPTRFAKAANLVQAALSERNSKSVSQNANRKKEQSSQVALRLAKILELVEMGRVTDIIFVGRDHDSGHFLTEIAVNPENPSDAFAFVGVLNALSLELTEQAQLSPAVMPDGSVLDPYLEVRR